MKSTFRIEAEANRDEAFPSGDRDKSSTTAFGSLNDETLKGKMSLYSLLILLTPNKLEIFDETMKKKKREERRERM